MALDDFQMPNFKDPDGSTWIWDSASKSYVKAPLTDKRPDQSHATGGDNDLFDPFQHSEMSSVPELEGYMAKKANDDPFRPADNWIECPQCGEPFGWNDEDGLWGQQCSCGYDFSAGDELKEQYGPWHVPEDWKHEANIDDPPFPSEHEVKCPNCGETTPEHVCPTCQKDLTPEWNVHGQENEFFDAHPDYNDAKEFWTWPQNVPKKNELNYDDSFPSMSLSKTAKFMPESGSWIRYFDTVAKQWVELRVYDVTDYGVFIEDTRGTSYGIPWDEWDERTQQGLIEKTASKTAEALPMDDGWEGVFNGEAPMRTEIGKWILDSHGQLHIDHGMSVTHPAIEQRDGLDQSQEIALGSVYNDGTADVQAVFQPQWFNLQAAQEQITQAFGPVELQPPMGAAEQKGQVFPPFEIQEGQWFVPPYTETITGIAWVKERSMGIEYEPHMILCAEHLRDDDFVLYSKGAAAIITAMGGASSHAAYLAMTSNLPIIVGVGEAYNKVETGNYLKIDPTSETITVIPGATGEMSSGQKHQIWNSILDYQRQRGGSVSQPQFSHFHEELAWKEANAPTLEDCPECSAPMIDQDGESVCHDCGHKQPIIHVAGAAALAVPELLGAGEAAGGAAGAGGGISGIGGLMNGALGRGMAFQTGKNLIGGGGGEGGEGGGSPLQGAADAAQAPLPFDPNAGTVSHQKFAAENMRHQAFLSEIWALIQNALKGVNWGNIGGALAANPIDDALFAAGTGAAGAANQSAQNALPQATAALGDDNVGLATDNDGTNSTEDASNSSIEGKKEQGDGPEQLKDVDGGHDSQDKDSGDNLQADPQLQDKALKAFHMNLPLVIEFANSDEPGADHPILQALDALLEEAFPGYKDGHDQENGATDEHPEDSPEKGADSESESPEERDKDVDEPDAKSEGDDKKEIHIHAKTASVWHFADLSDYEHWNEEAPRVWWEEEGRHEPEPDYGDPYDDYQQYGAQDAAAEELFESMGNLDDYDLEQLIAGDPRGQVNLPYMEHFSPEEIKAMAQDALADRQAQIPSSPEFAERNLGVEDHFGKTAAGGPEAWNMRRTLDGPWDAYQEEQPAAQGWGQGQWQPFQGEQPGATEAYSCQNCGEQHEFPATSDPRSLPSCPQCGARAWTHSGLQQTYAKTSTLDPGQPMGQPVPAGAGGPAMEMCPRCGQAHTAGSPCPVADVTTPLTTGEGMAAAPATHVVTKWHLAVPANVPASQPQIAAGAQAAPATTCPSCGQNHIPGTPCPTPQMQQPGATGQPANLATPAIGPGVQYAHTASDDESDHTEDHTEDHSDYHSEDDWTDEAGAPLEEGAQYEMRVAASPIPDRVTIERILPEKLSVLYHTGDVDFRDSITRDQLEMDGTTFTPVDFDDTDEDSMDTFPGEEMPIRPGADALPQEDDLSSPTTVMSNYEPVSLDTYTGSFAGDSVDDRSWLMEGDGSVDVDPALMAKVAGKNFSPREQREFIDESGTARNLDRLDLEGTHYIDEELHTSDSLW